MSLVFYLPLWHVITVTFLFCLFIYFLVQILSERKARKMTKEELEKELEKVENRIKKIDQKLVIYEQDAPTLVEETE